MQTIMESIFDIAYLIGVITLGVFILKKAAGRKQYLLFGAMAIVLGCGDAFHLIPRIAALLAVGSASLPAFAPYLGVGKLITSITMTAFYVMLYHVWLARYPAPRAKALTVCVYGLAIARVVLCLMPQNRWMDLDAPLSWGIYRNIPFVLLGLLIIVLYYRRREDKPFCHMWLAIALSFAFYLPVVLFVDTIPLLGMLMIPKTCAYVWMVWMGCRAVCAKESLPTP